MTASFVKTVFDKLLFSFLLLKHSCLCSLATPLVDSLTNVVFCATLDVTSQLQLHVLPAVRVEFHFKRVHKVIPDIHEVWVGHTNVASASRLHAELATWRRRACRLGDNLQNLLESRCCQRCCWDCSRCVARCVSCRVVEIWRGKNTIFYYRILPVKVPNLIVQL